MSEMTPEQYQRVKQHVMAFAEMVLTERARLLFYRHLHAQDRNDRGNHLPMWDWPHERRRRVKHETGD